MFDFVDRNKKFVQIILGLVILTFMFWGIESYRSGGANSIASVDGETIGANEYDVALRQQQERMRESLGKNADPALFDSPAFKLAVLERLIQQKLFLNQAQRAGIAVTDSQLVAAIQAIAAFQKDGVFSSDRYVALLRSQGLTPVRFELEVKQDLARQQLLNFVEQNEFVAHTSATRWLKIADQQRVFSQALFTPDQFLSLQSVGGDEIGKYYQSHLDEFKVPEQVRVSYLVLSPETLQSQIQVGEDEAKQYYEAHPADFSLPEERNASHILIALAKDASGAQVEAARSRARQILEELGKSPGKFAELAKQYSQDPGSAASGGSLGFFKRGMMVKSFDDAVFSMKPGQISDLVRSDFGFHIIRLDTIKPGKTESFSEAHDRIVQEVRAQKAGKKFSESADSFSNMVYEQNNSLKPAADAFKLPILESGWIDASGKNPAFSANKKLLQAIFSNDAMKKKRNTEAIELSPNTLVSAHVIEEKPASTRPLAEVSQDIKNKLLQQKAMDMALQQGKAKLAQMQAGKGDGISWQTGASVSRRNTHGVNADMLTAIFKADVSRLPAYVGVEGPQGYTLVRIDSVLEAPEPILTERRNMEERVKQSLVQQELSDYFMGLKGRAKITVNRDLASPKPAD
ncbi:MAG: SurA N-terminal domain-containing protein [Burkholderiales bacterium]|nr:SurA N-terminal domain-containing protein [Burkholderiales bacterium]